MAKKEADIKIVRRKEKFHAIGQTFKGANALWVKFDTSVVGSTDIATWPIEHYDDIIKELTKDGDLDIEYT